MNYQASPSLDNKDKIFMHTAPQNIIILSYKSFAYSTLLMKYEKAMMADDI